ncbi:MAG: DUF3006 domain-containing protein [Clostridiales bacterium]|nr:DUF3006 domain-containing protein [Clostridiales bacterium]
MKYIVDRIEADLAVCEDENEEMVNIPLKSLPEGVKEGSVVIRNGDSWELDPDEEAARKERIAEKMKQLRK